MKCPACGTRIAVAADIDTNRWSCDVCGLTWLRSGLRNSGTAPVLSYYCRRGDKDWKSVPSGCLLVLEFNGEIEA